MTDCNRETDRDRVYNEYRAKSEARIFSREPVTTPEQSLLTSPGSRPDGWYVFPSPRGRAGHGDCTYSAVLRNDSLSASLEFDLGWFAHHKITEEQQTLLNNILRKLNND